jgi:phosphopantothenoylcysteine decarboxylase / phosphopantothenate---cysteine ligase
LILISVGAAPGALAIPAVARELADAGQQVEVILGQKARHLVGPAAFGDATLVDDPSETPEAVLYAPATAETVARLARGLDRGAGALNVVAPELDAGTAEHPAVRENLDLLRKDGYRIVENPGHGMAKPEVIVAKLLGNLGGPMEGLRLLVTAGGTREPIDSVRFIGNRSSGKMGLAVAREALRRGADVTVVSANIGMVEPGTESHSVESAGELRDAVVDLAAKADALVMAAAVSDFTPASPVGEKIRRREGTTSLELVPTDDILASVTGRYPDLFVVGFAATHGDPLDDARDKLGRKGADLVVGNDISGEGVGFGADENEVYVVGREEEHFVPRASKPEVARIILDTMMNEMERQR